MRFAALSSLLKVNGDDIVGVRALNPLAYDGFEQLSHKHFMRIFSKFPNENVTEPGKIHFTPNLEYEIMKKKKTSLQVDYNICQG